MKKNKILKIVRYNLEKNLRNKWFIGLNILLFVVSIVALNFGTVKNILKQSDILPAGEKIKFEIVDKTDNFYDYLLENISNEENVEVIKANNPQYDENMEKDRVIIEVSPSETDVVNAKVISKDGIDQKYYSIIEDSLEKTKEVLIKEKYELTNEEISLIKDSVKVERIMVGVDNTNSDIKQIAQTVVNYLTLIILMLILSKIATDISQEKVSKSIEYVLTSISAKQYLVAKVISINLTMIIQLIFTFIYFIISSSINSILNLYIKDGVIDTMSNFSLSSISAMLDSTMIMYIAIVLVFLVLTVLLMCIIQAALTSKTTNISEAGNTTTILLTVNFVLYFVSTLLITPLKETNIIIYILSCVPIISMYFVPSMIIIGQANVIQIVIATIMLIVSIPVSLKICSKIFKNGILDNIISKKKEKNKDEEISKVKELNKIEKSDLSKYGYVIGMSIIIYVATQLLLTYMLAIFINPIHKLLGGVLSLSNVEMIINIIVFAGSLTLPALFVRAYTEEEKTDKNIDIKRMLKPVIIAVPFVVAVQFGIGILLEKLGLNYDIVDKINIYDGTSVISKVLFFIYIAILPAIFEEFYVRKAVLTFSKKYGNAFAIISSAILFAVLHMNISQSLFAFIMGIILGIVAIYSNSIIPTAIIHFLNNGYAALTMIFETNEIALLLINVIYIAMTIIGIVMCGVSFVKNRESVKKYARNIKNVKCNKNYKYIALDYTFILAFILMVVMLILTQKTISML